MDYKVFNLFVGAIFSLFYSCTPKIKELPQTYDRSNYQKDSIAQEIVFIDTTFIGGPHLTISSMLKKNKFDDIKVTINEKDSLIYKNMTVPDTLIRKIIFVNTSRNSLCFFTIRTSTITNGEALLGFKIQDSVTKALTFDSKIKLELFGCNDIYYADSKLQLICNKRTNSGDTLVHDIYIHDNDTSFTLIRNK